MIRLITGGARSGKSSFAESLFQDREDVVYIATSRVGDIEMKNRVRIHQERRPKSWKTCEANYSLFELIGGQDAYLLDCVSLLVSNIMFDISKEMDFIGPDFEKEIEEAVIFELEVLIAKIKENKKELVLVTNEVGMSIVPDNHISRVYRDILGRVNQKIASLSDEVYLVCCGLDLRIK